MAQPRSVIVVAAMAAGLWPSTASAQGMENTRSLTLSVGTGLSFGGDVITEAVGTIDDRPTVFVEQGYGNHFSDALRVRFTGSGTRLQQGSLRHLRLQQDERHGTDHRIDRGYPLYTRFSQHLGARPRRRAPLLLPPRRAHAHLRCRRRRRPVPEDRIGATIRVIEVGLTLSDLDYFESSTLFIFGADTGVSRDLSDTIAVGAEIGLRYQPKFKPAPSCPARASRASTTPAAVWGCP